MKSFARFSITLVALLIVLSGCSLFNAINLAWSIISIGPASPTTTRVTYSVQNLGKLDLTGVNLEIGVDVTGTGLYPYSAWTPDFSINVNQTLYGSLDVYTGGYAGLGATVLSVDMDNPPN